MKIEDKLQFVPNEVSVLDIPPLIPKTVDSLPATIRDVLIECANLDRADQWQSNFYSVAELRYSNGEVSYVASFKREDDEDIDEEDTFVIDTNDQTAIMGVGEIRFFRNFRGMPDRVGYPFVGYTVTKSSYTRISHFNH